MNFIRCRLALETLPCGAQLQVTLDRGEPEAMVLPGLQQDGHAVSVLHTDADWLRIVVTRGPA